MIPAFSADTIFEGRAVVAVVDGKIPRDSVSEANEVLVALLGRGCRFLVIDCSRMTEVSSNGIGLVAYHAAAMKQRGGVLLLVPPPSEVVRRAGGEALRSIVRFVPSVDEALSHVREALEQEH